MVSSDDEQEPTLTNETEARFRRLLYIEYSKYSAHTVRRSKAAQLRSGGVFPCDLCPFRCFETRRKLEIHVRNMHTAERA